MVIGEHAGVTFGFHLCRGNQMSRWLVSGGYDWLAGQLFPRIHADRLLLEYDDERSGSFDALAAVPERTTVVLGLVTTKTGRVETVDELADRIREASRFVPLERLALYPNVGSGHRSAGIRSRSSRNVRSFGRSRRPPRRYGSHRPDDAD